ATNTLCTSGIPCFKPFCEVRLEQINGEYVIEPDRDAMKESTIDLIVGATLQDITMVEGELSEASEEEVIEALKVAHEAIKIQCIALKEFEEACGKTQKREYEGANEDEALKQKIREFAYDRIYAIASAGTTKHERRDKFTEIHNELVEKLE